MCLCWLVHRWLVFVSSRKERELNVLTAEGFDGHGVVLVFRGDAGTQADHKHVSKADNECHNPDEHPQNDVGQQVLEGGDAVSVGLAAPHVRGVATVLETLEITERKCNNIKSVFYIFYIEC